MWLGVFSEKLRLRPMSVVLTITYKKCGKLANWSVRIPKYNEKIDFGRQFHNITSPVAVGDTPKHLAII